LADALVPLSELRAAVARVLAVTARGAGPGRRGGELDSDPIEDEAPLHIEDGWVAVERSRHPDRPSAWAVVERAGEAATMLRGDGTGSGDDPAGQVALARIGGIGVVVVAQVRRGGRGSTPSAVGLSKGRRAMALAEELRLPLVLFVDTAGPDPRSNLQSHAAAVAQCLFDLAGLSTPSLAVLLGEGSGGTALAFLCADRVVAAEGSWLAPISPEGASVILHGTVDRAAEVARAQAVAASSLLRSGLVHSVVPEPRPAHDEPEAFIDRMSAAVIRHLRDLVRSPLAR
jgi:acetyl-CoA carboxylase carboxyl transferase subunit beta